MSKTKFIETASSINTSTKNEYKLNIKQILQNLQNKKFEKQDVVDAVTQENQIKAYWVVGWESDLTDGLMLGTVMVTLKDIPVATLTMTEGMSFVSWINSDLKYETYDYVKSFLKK